MKTQRFDLTTDLRSVIRNPAHTHPKFLTSFLPLEPLSPIFPYFYFLYFSCLFSFLLENFAHTKAQHLQQRSTPSRQHRLLNSSIYFYFIFCSSLFHTYFPSTSTSTYFSFRNFSFPKKMWQEKLTDVPRTKQHRGETERKYKAMLM